MTSWGERQLGHNDRAPISLERAALIESGFDGESWEMRVNGQVFVGPERVEGKKTGQGPLIIGLGFAALFAEPAVADFFRGDIAEIIVYNRAITADERATIESYLRARYALF